jgi:hypothetical protein
VKFFFSDEKIYGADGATLRVVSREFEPVQGMRYCLTPKLTAPRPWDAVEASLNWVNAPEGFEIVMNGQAVHFEKPTDVGCSVTVTPFFSQNRQFFAFEPLDDNAPQFTSGVKRLLKMWMKVVEKDDTFVLELDIAEDPI